jgi:DTW domain-containing protein YfiP
MHLRLCICDRIERSELETRVVVLTHQMEACKTTNTGRLVPLALSRGEVRIRGTKGHPLDTTGIVELERLCLFLFPCPESVELSRELLEADGRPVTLVVPDGNWRQAGKTNRREKGLLAVQRVHLPPGPPSRYRLRSHRDPRKICTLEAVARALEIVEGPEVQARLERLLEVMVERTLWSRGKLPGDQVSGGIPPAGRR